MILDCTSTASLKKILASLLSWDFVVLTAGPLIMNPFFDVFLTQNDLPGLSQLF